MCWYNIRPARLIQRPTLEWLRPVCVCFHLLKCRLQNYMPDAVQSVLNNNVTQPARILNKKYIFLQTTRYWQNAEKLAVGLRDNRCPYKRKTVCTQLSNARISYVTNSDPWSGLRTPKWTPGYSGRTNISSYRGALCVIQANTWVSDVVRQPYLRSYSSVYLFLQNVLAKWYRVFSHTCPLHCSSVQGDKHSSPKLHFVWRERNQQDATIRCLLLTSVSTRFGHHYAHLWENKDPVTTSGVLFWCCWMWLVVVVGRCLVGCEHYEGFCSTQPHPAEPEYTKCSNRVFDLLKMGIMMPETCWDRS